VYDEHRLFKGRGRRTKVGTKNADDECERRDGTREAYRELSRYYPLEEQRTEWRTPQLLLKGERRFGDSTSRYITYPIFLQCWRISRPSTKF
jgi:hypothetical protein